MKNKINQKGRQGMKNVRKKSENIRWKLWILSAGIALLLMAGGVRIHKLKEEKYELQNRLEREVQQNIAKEVLRFHVIANSDTKEDQKLKMQVKTELLEYMNGFLKESDGLEETKEIVLGHLTEIKQTAKEIVEESGYEYRVEAKMEKCEFPEKVYGNCTFPKGEYETLTVTIGAGKGHNWWCVLYPNMCFRDSVYEIVDEDAKEELQEVLSPEEYEDVFTSGNYEVHSRLLDYFK